MTEIKKTVNEESIDVLISSEANATKENIKFYNMDGYTIYALYKSRQIASGINPLTSTFHISKVINEADTKKLANMSDVLEGLLVHVTSVFCRYTSSYLQTQILFIHW